MSRFLRPISSLAACCSLLIGLTHGVSQAEPSAAETADAIPASSPLPASAETTSDPELTQHDAPPSSARTNLLITGAATTLGFYGLGYGTSYLWPNSPVADELRLPLIGSYAAVFGAGCGPSEAGCTTFMAVVRTALASISAIGQTGGLLLLAEGVFMTTDSSSAVRGASSPSETREAASETDWYATPLADGDQLGLIVGGSF